MVATTNRADRYLETILEGKKVQKGFLLGLGWIVLRIGGVGLERWRTEAADSGEMVTFLLELIGTLYMFSAYNAKRGGSGYVLAALARAVSFGREESLLRPLFRPLSSDQTARR